MLNEVILSIKEKERMFKKEFSNKNLLNYRFVKNIINPNILEEYYLNHENNFNNNFKDIRKVIDYESGSGYSNLKRLENFEEYFNSTLSSTINNIIDFNILEYLNGDYENRGLFIKEDFSDTIQQLLSIAEPFFNADNSFNSNNSHQLMLHNNNVNEDSCLDHVRLKLKRCFPSSVPQQIETKNNNKFSIILIDVIPDFQHIVKYNESEKAYLNAKTESINTNEK